MRELKKSTVVFNSEDHSYMTEYNALLSGITGMIDRQIFGGAFANLPEAVWKDKADNGTQVHEDIEMALTLMTEPTTPEGKAFFREFIYTEIIRPYQTEYLVSDEERFATKIDLVDTDLNLYDYKTSSGLNVESVSWQLSICAYLFELQNGFQCGNLYAVHLTEDAAELVRVNRKPVEAVKALLEAEAYGLAYLAPQATEEANLAVLTGIEEAIITFKAAIVDYEAKKDAIISGITAKMEEMGIKKWETEKIIVTKIDPTTRETLDTKKLKEEMPEIFGKYAKASAVKGGIRVTIKKDKQ